MPGQRENLGGDARAQRQRAIGADAAVLHDRKPRLARGPAHGVEEVGEAVLVQPAGDQDAGRDGEQRRQHAVPEV